MSRDHNAGRSHSTKTDNSNFESVEVLKYLGKTTTNQNFIHEVIKSRMNSGNPCYHSVQSLSSYTLLSIDLKIKKYINIILPVFCKGVNLGCSN
jgi:hypothetical protein